MDLMSAKVEAADLSRKERRKKYIVVDGEGECEIVNAPLKGVIHCFSNGAEIPIDSDPNELGKETPTKPTKGKTAAPVTKTAITTNQSENMETKNRPAAKKAAKKVAPAKKIAANTSKSNGEKVVRGNNMSLTPAEWKKVDAILNKEEISFSAWSRNLVLAKIK